MNHEETLEAIEMRSRIEKLDVDPETRERILAGMPEPKSVPWDLVSETIKAREEAVFKDDLLENMIIYYKKAIALAEWRLEDAERLKEVLTDQTETTTIETWGQR